MSDYLNLPRELFVEILVRLPIEDLVKSTSVCKSWNSLIKTPTFISTHFEKTISFNNTNLLFFRLRTRKSPWIHDSLRLDNSALDEYKQLPYPNIGGSGFRVAGSYNGLVCLVENMDTYDSTFILWNPVIKKAIRLPEPSVEFLSHGPMTLLICLVLAFDVSEEFFTEIPLPDCLSHDSICAQLLKYGQSSIAVAKWNFLGPLIDLWVMKEYGVAASWTKVLTETANTVQRVLFSRQDEQVCVTMKGGCFASVDIKSEHYKLFGVPSAEKVIVVDSYVESLVLLDKCCN